MCTRTPAHMHARARAHTRTCAHAHARTQTHLRTRTFSPHWIYMCLVVCRRLQRLVLSIPTFPNSWFSISVFIILFYQLHVTLSLARFICPNLYCWEPHFSSSSRERLLQIIKIEIVCSLLFIYLFIYLMFLGLWQIRCNNCPLEIFQQETCWN